jgi:chemotaxis protein CheZ
VKSNRGEIVTKDTASSELHSEAENKILTLIQKENDVSLSDVMHFAESMAKSMDSYFGSVDKKIYREFCEIGDSIAKMRNDIGQLQPNDLKNAHIPRAGDELAAIVSTTEEATETIMSGAEAIMEADSENPEAYQEVVFEQVMKIMEACSFQDLTGQRISKVVETLEHIEQRISSFAAAIGDVDGEVMLSEEDTEREQRRKDLILNGPQSQKDAIAQSAVDDMFSGPSEDSDQDNIDNLFS